MILLGKPKMLAVVGILAVVLGWRLASMQGQTEGEIAGVITDDAGKPVAGALVGVLDEQTASLKDAQTAVDGRFRVGQLSRASLYRLVVTKYGFQQASLAGVKVPAEIRLQLHHDAISAASLGSIPALLESLPFDKPDGSQEKPFTLSVAVEEVLLNVSVEDSAGRTIPGLKKEDFTILQDGATQSISSFGRENVPLSALLLIDISSSMQGSSIVEAKVAALAFLSACRPLDAVSLVAFNEKVQVVRPFTQDALQLRTGVHSLTPSGGTALYDALSQAIDMMAQAPHPRHVIVLLSDGQDEDSVTKFANLEKKVQASDVVVFSVGEYGELDRKAFMSSKKYYKPPEVDANLSPAWILRDFADVSGGRAFFPKLGDPLEPLFAEIAERLHEQYVMTYRPNEPPARGRFHNIEVRLNDSRLSSFVVRTRKGYLSP